ncbi:MAG TPA: stage III sporulation protein AF [Candidatus Merdicola faecigallinarum]|uniref:Stage III sporulation protein AF n=1 Tax=Candidatus Merdicola faecigallinarum TaxID=2840862 RepID=A0A9D1M0V7_9FIRM|nr:stage III sporulation protein AF [Candidatus Merdicola faecigallinarum]
MEWMTTWAQGIIVAVIITTIIELILPEGNHKKYIKMVMGVYILFTIVSPIITKITNQDFEFDESKYEEFFKNSTYEVSSQSLEEENDNQIKDLYLNNIKSDVKQKLKEQGYIVEEIQIEADLESEEAYGKIKKMNLQIKKGETKQEENKISPVNRIEIGEKKEGENQISGNEEKIGGGEIQEIKTYLSTTYDVEKKQIKINES